MPVFLIHIFKCPLPPRLESVHIIFFPLHYNERMHSQLHRKIFLFTVVLFIYMLACSMEFYGSLVLSALQACNWDLGWSDDLGCRHQTDGCECVEWWQNNNWNSQHAPTPLPFLLELCRGWQQGCQNQGTAHRLEGGTPLLHCQWNEAVTSGVDSKAVSSFRK